MPGKFAVPDVLPTPGKKRSRITPKASQLTFNDIAPVPAPPHVADCLGGRCECWIAIDVETHILVPPPNDPERKFFFAGQFGFEATVGDDQLSLMRVVQVGWTVGGPRAAHPTTSERLVRPNGFCIADSATEKHGITQAMAIESGQSLETVLGDLVTEICNHCAKGARLVSHHLEFDAGMIAKELGNAGLEHLQAPWDEAARRGACTMQPCIGNWVRDMVGILDVPWFIPMKLSALFEAMVPHRRELLQKHHTAGCDSLMRWFVCQALVQRVNAQRLCIPSA